MPKFVRHQPGYTPEKAAERRRIRALARQLGMKPRALNRKWRAAAWSSAAYMLKFLANAQFGGLAGRFHSGGFIDPRREPPLLFGRPEEHRVPLELYRRLPAAVPLHDAPKDTEVKALVTRNFTFNADELDVDSDDPRTRELMEEVVRKRVDKLWEKTMVSLTTGGHVADVPAELRAVGVISNPGA